MAARLLLNLATLPLSLLSAHAPPTPMEPMPMPDVPTALTILPPLVELSTLTRLFAIAWKTFMEMLEPLHALLAIMAVPLLLRHPPLPLSLLSAHAPPTPTEMVPPAQTALITLQDLLGVLVPVSLPKLLACVRPTSTVMPEPAHALLVLTTAALLHKHALPLSKKIACVQKTPTELTLSPHAPLALLILGHLLDLLPLRIAVARLTFMEMLKQPPPHALLALIVVFLVLKLQQLPLPQLTASARRTLMVLTLPPHVLLARTEVLQPPLEKPQWRTAPARLTTSAARQHARLARITVPTLVAPLPLLIVHAQPAHMQPMERMPPADAPLVLLTVPTLEVKPLVPVACAK